MNARYDNFLLRNQSPLLVLPVDRHPNPVAALSPNLPSSFSIKIPLIPLPIPDPSFLFKLSLPDSPGRILLSRLTFYED